MNAMPSIGRFSNSMKHANVAPKRTLLVAVVSAILAIGLMVPVTSASAVPSSSSKKAEAQAALDKLNDMQATLDQASNNYSEAEAERAAAEQKVTEAEAQIQEETKKIKGYQEELGTRARSMYRTGGNTFLDVILGASTFEEFATNWNILETMNENDAELVAKTKESRQKVEAAKAEYETQEQVAAEKADEAKRIKDEAEATTAQMQETYDNLNAEVQELLRQEEEARSAANAAAAQQAIASGNAGGNAGNSTSSSSNAGSSKPANNSKPQTVTGNVVVDRAYSQLGKPYGWGAAGPNSFDCSGLVGYCLTGRMGSHWCTTGTIQGWTRVSNPQPGDICINSHHTGIYIGGGQMIHAPRTGDVVKVSGVHSGMWYVRY